MLVLSCTFILLIMFSLVFVTGKCMWSAIFIIVGLLGYVYFLSQSSSVLTLMLYCGGIFILFIYLSLFSYTHFKQGWLTLALLPLFMYSSASEFNLSFDYELVEGLLVFQNMWWMSLVLSILLAVLLWVGSTFEGIKTLRK